VQEAQAVGEGVSLERAWWERVYRVLYRPREVFEALRDDSDEAAEARQEPTVAIVFLGGIAAVLATGAAARLLDDPEYDGLLIALWAVVAGAIYGLASYWVVGGAVYVGQHGAGGQATYRHTRHLLAFASVPILVWFVAVWPVRLALYGTDLFRTGGSDGGVSRAVFGGIGAVFLAWCLGLLALGIRTAYDWDWRRSSVAVSLAAAALAALALAALVLR
jgi:hypothetical protein